MAGDPVSVRIDDETLDRLDLLAQKRRVSRHSVMQLLLENGLIIHGFPAPPPPLSAGEMVYAKGWSATPATIIAIDGEWAWLRNSADNRIVAPISDLRRAV